MRRPKVSVLCVTHERPVFIPFLMTQFAKQSMADDAELVLIDSSPNPLSMWQGEGIRHVYAAENHVGRKYQLAQELAEGQALTLWGDDDWHHSRELETAWKVLSGSPEASYVGWRESWYYDLWTGRTARYRAPNRRPGASSCLVRTSVARRSRFTKVIASDTEWFEAFEEDISVTLQVPMPHALWIVHGGNMTPWLGDIPWDGTFDALMQDVTTEEYESAKRELDRLKRRLGGVP